MDIMMPVEDGLSAVRRAREAGVRTPVLFLTCLLYTSTKHPPRSAARSGWALRSGKMGPVNSQRRKKAEPHSVATPERMRNFVPSARQPRK